MKAHERLLYGAPNARDLGGIVTLDGRKVKKNRLIRSGQLSALNDEDERVLKTVGLRKVVDLRTLKEMSEKPDRVIEGVEYVSCRVMPEKADGIERDIPENEEEEAIRTVAMAKRLIAKNPDAREQIKSLYPLFVSLPHCIEHYAEFFRILLNTEEGAVLFHCTLGKDRAGTAAALTLYALGVSREEIVKDYLITAERCAEGTKSLLENCRKYTDDEAVLEYIYRLDTVEESFIDAAFLTAEKLYGSVDGFLENSLGLDGEKLMRLRELYLE